MRVLIITEKLDKKDEIAGLFHSRLLDFVNECEKLTVMVLENKAHDLPEKVAVVSLGKENGVSRLDYLFNFYRYMFKHSSDYDYVFIHRNPIYVILGGLFWKLAGKNIVLWYSHVFVDWKLHLSLFFVDNILSPSKDNFPISTSKLVVFNGLHDLDCYVRYVNANK